jgi:deoxyribose-phosphate aldolase
MKEQDLRKIVEEIVRVLADKGLLKDSCACDSPSGITKPMTEGRATTIGTAGKVFSDTWRPTRNVSPDAPRAQSSLPANAPAEHTGGDNCPHCEPVAKCSESQLKALGADRIAVCHPTKKGTATARYVDHTLLKPNATQDEVAKLCEEARAFCFASVCINPSYVAYSAQLLRGTGVKICTVVGFPLGSTTPTVKAIEARDAIANGADEIDMVINVGALKSGNDAAALEDIKAVREATRGRVLKVILETSFLSQEEKVRACLLAKKAGADFVKTSTGFGGGGATVEDIRLMRQTVGPLMGVKASGGIRDAAAAQQMIDAGATRLGTSASVAIVSGEAAESGKKGY